MTRLDYANAQMALLVMWGDTPQARQIISEHPPIGYIPGLFESFVAAQNLIESKDYDLAKALLQRLPQSAVVQIWLAEISHNEGCTDAAISSLEKLRKTVPNDAYLLSQLSFLNGEMGDLEAAISIGSTIIEGTTEEDFYSQTYLYNAHYNIACWEYKQQETADEPDFSEVYGHLEKCRDLEGEMIGNSFRRFLPEDIKKDMKQGYFRKIKNEKRFLELRMVA